MADINQVLKLSWEIATKGLATCTCTKVLDIVTSLLVTAELLTKLG